MSKEKKNTEINENNASPKNRDNKKKRLAKKKRKVILRVTLLLVLVALIIVGGAVFGMVMGIIKNAPEIDATNVLTTLTESSVIVDENGNVIEQIHDPNENREIVPLSQIPKHLQNAFIAIEDHRFDDHFGIDIRRIAGALLHNVREGDPTAQGASDLLLRSSWLKIYILQTKNLGREKLKKFICQYRWKEHYQRNRYLKITLTPFH